MGKFVEPKVFVTGYTTLDLEGIYKYLQYTDQNEFREAIREAKSQGLSDGEILCSFYAKTCYKSLTDRKNKNIKRVRDISDNLINTFDQAHGSVFEHATVNFICTDCSRVLTHELVRQRAGWAYSQTSGRFVRGDSVDIVYDKILDPARDIAERFQKTIEEMYAEMSQRLDVDNIKDKDEQKRVTSALRRFLPNGQSNEIGFSVNFRAIRHFIMLRTNGGAEWEIRSVAAQVYELLKSRNPLLFYKAKERMVRGLPEIYGMKMQPYELHPDDPNALSVYTPTQLEVELAKRRST